MKSDNPDCDQTKPDRDLCQTLAIQHKASVLLKRIKRCFEHWNWQQMKRSHWDWWNGATSNLAICVAPDLLLKGPAYPAAFLFGPNSHSPATGTPADREVA